PLLAVKWSPIAKQVHITRSILCRAWESYSDETGAILSRETVKRVRELVGTIELNEMRTALDFRDELIALLFYAVAGTSRLPLTSLESPLPQFVLGQLAYCFRPHPSPIDSRDSFLAEALRPDLARIENVKLIEWVFRQWSGGTAERLVHHLQKRGDS